MKRDDNSRNPTHAAAATAATVLATLALLLAIAGFVHVRDIAEFPAVEVLNAH